MRPEWTAALVARWVRWYTRGLPAEVAERRTGEIAADLHDHVAHDRAAGVPDRRIALGILSRLVRGLEADAAWRGRHAVRTHRTAYLAAAGLAFATAFSLFWLIGAVGVIGESGDRADMLYLGVFAVGIVGSVVARLRPWGMARVLLAMALATALVAVIAIVAGEHRSPVTSVGEILGVNAMFVALFAGAAWLFRFAAPRRRPRDQGWRRDRPRG
jgi:lysylphosphatidylglycerol synthetase-like protein (DUF2156 family)